MADQRISLDASAGALDGTEIVPLVRVGSPVTAGSFVVGTAYVILSVGTTDFTAIGAASNTVGIGFVATSAGSGTGTAGPTSNVRTTTQTIANKAASGSIATASDVSLSGSPPSAGNNDFFQFLTSDNKWHNRTPTQATATLDAVVGDSGSGGTKGLAPAPGAGDAAAGKFLKADGTYAIPPGTGSGAISLISTQTASSSADIHFTGLTGDRWRAIGHSLLPASISTFNITVGNGGIPTYISSGYYNGAARAALTVSETLAQVSGINQAAWIFPGVSSHSQRTTAPGISFVLDFLSDSSTYIYVGGWLVYTASADGHTRLINLAGIVANAAAVTGIKFAQSTGNIASGRISLYSLSD